MGDTSGCQISSNNLAVYLQGVSVEPSTNLTSQYFVTASLPSSVSTKRVWQFTTQGTITGPDVATLTLDYTQAYINCPLYNITFEGALNGLLTVKNQVFSANKFMSYTLTSAYVLVLTLRIPKTILECFGPGKTQHYSFDVYVNDAVSLSFSYTTNNSLVSTTLYGSTISSSGSLCTWSSTQTYYTDPSGTPFTDPSGTQVYTGYLQIEAPATLICYSPTSLTLNLTDFPTSDSPFVALLGILYDFVDEPTMVKIPSSLTINWGTTTVPQTQTLSVLGTLPSGNYYCNYGYILVYDSSTSTWNVQDVYANPFYIITCTLNKLIPGNNNIYDANNNFLYSSYQESGSDEIIIALQDNDVFTGSVYISFPLTPVSNNSVQVVSGFTTTSPFYFTNPSTSTYQVPPFPFNELSENLVYYCTDPSGNNTVWQLSSCSS
jgi:hypothetical protein